MLTYAPLRPNPVQLLACPTMLYLDVGQVANLRGTGSPA